MMIQPGYNDPRVWHTPPFPPSIWQRLRRWWEYRVWAS